jgi:hypothetical protein
MSEERETLNAFVDGQLPPEEMTRVAALLVERPDLENYVRQQERLRTVLKMQAVMTAPVPQALVQTAQLGSVSWRWWSARQLSRRPGWILSAGAAALALSLVLGVVTRPDRDISLSRGQMVAEGNLRKALDSKLASTGYDGKGPRVGLSFRDRSGADCRTFSEGRTAGLACRTSGRWMIQAMARHEDETGPAPYRMAGSEMPDVIRRAVEARISGAPYDAAAEAKARAAGWPGAR